jgi:cytochrome c peroxidase
MRKIKILVVFSFVLASFGIFGSRLFSPLVTGQSLLAPTSVIASDGVYFDKVGIMWSVVRGANLYRIFRNTTNNSSTATDVGNTLAGYFFDSTAITNQTYFYWVRAENGVMLSDFSSPDQGLRANGSILPGPVEPLNPPFAPAGNPVTAAKAALGKALFWDEQLSSTKTVSCGTCHQAAKGGSDPRTIFNSVRAKNPGFDGIFDTLDDVFGSPGVPSNNLNGTYNFSSIFGFNEQVTGRKAPSYLNAAYTNSGLFWDGRASDVFRDPLTSAVILTSRASLESQVLGPPLSSGEMAHGGRNWTEVATRVSNSKPLALATNVPTALQNWIGNRTYAELFEEAFGSAGVTPSRIAMAIATHERTLFSDQTPFDRAISQIEPLTANEESGRVLFETLNCNACHGGALLADHNFHNIGVRPVSEDVGRGSVTSIADDNGRFKTPNLRNIELRAPYMHNGKFSTLEEVVEFYNRGGDFDAPNIDHDLIRPLNLTTIEKQQLVAFMKRPLTDSRVRDELPPFDRPTLYTETSRVPVLTGTGRNGTGGIEPKATAIEPPLLGNPSFTVAVSKGLGNAAAVLVINSTDPGVGTTIPTSGSFARISTTLSGLGGGNGYGSLSLAIPNNPTLIGQTYFGRWYITDASAANGFSVSQAFRFTIFSDASAIQHKYVDFDGDGKSDISIFRPSVGEWYYLRSGNGAVNGAQFGSLTDKTVPADYTGDGKTDVAFFRPSSGEWFVIRSEDSSFYAFPFGISTDIPTPGDFDGDGKADVAVFRPSTGIWYINKSTGGVTIQPFGVNGDRPVVADYDGDGKSDIAIFRPSVGEWYALKSGGGISGAQFGSSSDKTVQGDYTGDGKADFAFYRPSTGSWFVLRSEDSSFFASPFGVATDTPTIGDYDGDGKFDQAVFRPSNGVWYVNKSNGSGVTIQPFGVSTDAPVPSYYLP